jgi:predicted dithiol-disulfide oxidoreductase (DUF899 family)
LQNRILQSYALTGVVKSVRFLEETMTIPRVVSPEEWRSARKQLLAEEKAFTRERDALNERRRRLPMVEVAKPYRFEGSSGSVGLIELFDGRRQLIVYHFMFDPAWDEGCPMCSFLVDNVGHLSHLRDARDTSLVLVSQAPLAKSSASRRAWGGSCRGSRRSTPTSTATFTSPSTRPSRRSNTTTETRLSSSTSVWGGSTAASITASACSSATVTACSTRTPPTRGGGDLLLGTYNYLDLTPLGRQEQGPGSHEFRHHDRYAT